MYSIGMFSKINKITTKTLRYYDEIGLLKPSHVDEATGYRFYTTDELPKLHKIITLKQMGLSLEKIKEILNDSNKIKKYLDEQVEKTKKDITDSEIKLKQLKNYYGIIDGDYLNSNKYTPIIKELPEVIIASMRLVVDSYEDFFNLCPNVMGPEMERVGCVCRIPEYCFNIYHDGEYKEKNIDVEICEAITEMKEDTPIVKFKKIPKVETAVCVLHKGPYSTLREAYMFIFSWIKNNNYTVLDMPRESYIDGIWNKDSEEDWLTELQVPVKMTSK